MSAPPMNFTTAVLFLGILVALGFVLWGLFSPERSPLIALLALAVALFAAFGAWYAWAETKSTPWTIGYSIVAAAGLISAVRQLFGGGPRAE
jgi:hypothetical protein